MMETILESIEQQLGPAPRRNAAVARKLRRPLPPAWLGLSSIFNDRLSRLWWNQKALVRDGTVVFGYIYMANMSLFEAGSGDAPAGVVYSLDPFYRRNPGYLTELGHTLYGFYEANQPVVPEGPWQRLVFESVYDGTARQFALAVPPILSGGRETYHSSIMIHRSHLPHGWMGGNLVPLLVDPIPERNGKALIVPSAFWPDQLLAMWAPD